MKVILLQDDIDYYDGEKHIGVAIFKYDESFQLEDKESLDDYLASKDCIDRVYGPSEEAAMHNALLECSENNYEVVLS